MALQLNASQRKQFVAVCSRLKLASILFFKCTFLFSYTDQCYNLHRPRAMLFFVCFTTFLNTLYPVKYTIIMVLRQSGPLLAPYKYLECALVGRFSLGTGHTVFKYTTYFSSLVHLA